MVKVSGFGMSDKEKNPYIGRMVRVYTPTTTQIGRFVCEKKDKIVLRDYFVSEPYYDENGDVIPNIRIEKGEVRMPISYDIEPVSDEFCERLLDTNREKKKEKKELQDLVKKFEKL